jgi:hypothetical protein
MSVHNTVYLVFVRNTVNSATLREAILDGGMHARPQLLHHGRICKKRASIAHIPGYMASIMAFIMRHDIFCIHPHTTIPAHDV